jgi:hypothetical protein
MKKKKVAVIVSTLLLGIAPMMLWSEKADALPVFARKYHTSCNTCHSALPVRNGFGEAFRNNGYRFPAGTDEEMVKEEPIKLGQDAYKNVFPDAVWPSDMPNMPSLGFLAKLRYYMPEGQDGSGMFETTKIYADLETFFAGTITENITYFGDFAINQDGLEWGKLNLVWAFRPGLNLVLGEVGITEKMVLISARPGWKRDGYMTTMPAVTRGLEIRYAANTGSCGGYSLVAGLGKNSFDDPEGGGTLTDSKFVRATYKIGGNGLLSGVGGTLGNNFIGLDNSVTFGVNYYHSDKGGQPSNQEGLIGLTRSAVSGDIEANYGSFRLLAQYLYSSKILDEADKSIGYGSRNAYSLEGDYWIYPWLVGVLRYEYLKDDYNGRISKIIPGVAVFLRPNAKVGMEYVNLSTKDAPYYEGRSSFQVFAHVGF